VNEDEKRIEEMKLWTASTRVLMSQRITRQTTTISLLMCKFQKYSDL